MKLFQNKKILLIVSLFVFIIFVASTILFFSKSQSKISPDTTIAPQISLIPTKTPMLTPYISPTITIINAVQYKAPKFSINYPETWQPSAQHFQGGNATTILSKKLPGDPMIVIEVYDTVQNVTQKQALYLAEGCIKGSITVTTKQFDKINCSFKMRMINGVAVKGSTQQQMIYIPTAKSLYVIRYYYTSTQSNPIYENLLIQMLKTFQPAE